MRKFKIHAGIVFEGKFVYLNHPDNFLYMNRKILFLEVIAALAIVWGFSMAGKPTSPIYQTSQQVYQNRFMVQC